MARPNRCGGSRPTWRSATSRSPTAPSTSASPTPWRRSSGTPRRSTPRSASPGSTSGVAGADRRRGPAGRGRRARRPVPDRRVPDRLGHVDEHERQRGARRRWRPTALGDGRCHPNDHVNASQSSNDTVPAAIRLAVARLLVDDVHPAVDALIAALRVLAERFADVVKAGRTHLMDATPVTLGQEADAWAGLLAGALAPLAGRRRRARRAAARRHRGRHGHQRPAGVRADGDRRAGRRDRAAAAAEPEPDDPPGRAGRAGRGVGRAARVRRGADEDRQRHPPAGQRTVGRAGRAAPPRAAGRARRSCPARSTRCCASRSTRSRPGCSATTPRSRSPRRRASSS